MTDSALDAALESSSDDGAAPAQKTLFDLGLFRAVDDPVGYERSERRQQAGNRKSIEEGKVRAASKSERLKQSNTSRQQRFRDNCKMTAAARGEAPKQRGRPRVTRSPDAANDNDAEDSDGEQSNPRRSYKVCVLLICGEVCCADRRCFASP